MAGAPARAGSGGTYKEGGIMKTSMQKMVGWLENQRDGYIINHDVDNSNSYIGGSYDAISCAIRKAHSLLAEEKAQESLAELADRKGWKMLAPIHADTFWVVQIADNHGKLFSSNSDTYSQTEAKAREYLNGLEDKK